VLVIAQHAHLGWFFVLQQINLQKKVLTCQQQKVERFSLYKNAYATAKGDKSEFKNPKKGKGKFGRL